MNSVLLVIRPVTISSSPSVYESFAEFLMRSGVTSMSVNPDTVVYARRLVAPLEREMLLERIFAIDRGDKIQEIKIG